MYKLIPNENKPMRVQIDDLYHFCVFLPPNCFYNTTFEKSTGASTLFETNPNQNIFLFFSWFFLIRFNFGKFSHFYTIYQFTLFYEYFLGIQL